GDAPGLVQLGAGGRAVVAAVPKRPVSSKRVDGVGLAKCATRDGKGENCGREQAHGESPGGFPGIPDLDWKPSTCNCDVSTRNGSRAEENGVAGPAARKQTAAP